MKNKVRKLYESRKLKECMCGCGKKKKVKGGGVADVICEREEECRFLFSEERNKAAFGLRFLIRKWIISYRKLP